VHNSVDDLSRHPIVHRIDPHRACQHGAIVDAVVAGDGEAAVRRRSGQP